MNDLNKAVGGNDAITDKERLAAFLEAYKTARTEIIDRIKQRDLAYSIYLVGISAVSSLRAFSLFLEKDDKSVISYFRIPLAPLTIYSLLAFVFASIVSQHHIQIGRLGFFCDEILSRKRITELLKEDFLNWETFVATRGNPTLSILLNAHIFLFVIPPVIASLAQTSLFLFSYYPEWLNQASTADSQLVIVQRTLGLCTAALLVSMSWTFTFFAINVLKKSIHERMVLEYQRSHPQTPDFKGSKYNTNFYFSLGQSLAVLLALILFGIFLYMQGTGSFRRGPLIPSYGDVVGARMRCE